MDRRPPLRACAPYEPDWIAFPKGFIRDPEVSPLFKGMMAVLCDFLDWTTGLGSPTYRALEAATGLKKWRIRQLIRGVAALGYVDVDEQPGNGLEYRLKGGPLRLDLTGEGGTARPHPPGTARPHPPGTARPHPIDLIDDDLIWVLEKNYEMGAADAAAVAASMPPDRLRQLLAYIDANPQIAHRGRYILAAAKKEPRQRRRAAPRVEQLALKSPGELEHRRAAAVAASVNPPEGASWLTDEEREARSLQAMRETRERTFPQYAQTRR
jgi:hypothetical protein